METTTSPEATFRRRKGSKHDKTGCLTCRHRRKKCVENTFPICGTCKRLNLKCVREPVRNIVPQPGDAVAAAAAVAGDVSIVALAARPVSICPPVAGPFMPVTVVNGESRISQKRHVMGYYITVLTRHLTVSEQFNSFLSAFLPMAMESPVLSDALFAFASGHLSLVDPSYKVTALEARSAALRNLAIAIKTPSNDITCHETKAAACLAFLTSEVGTGDRQTWHSHLQGTMHIISSASASSAGGEVRHGADAFKISPEGQWILRNFAYHDIIGSVTLRKRPLLEGKYLEGICDVIDSYLGVATELLRFIAEISCLDQDTKISPQMPPEEARQRKSLFQTSCAPLEQRLQDWHCHPDTAPGLSALAYAYKSAVLIYFYRLARGRLCDSLYVNDGAAAPLNKTISGILQHKMKTNLRKILAHVSEIPLGTSPECALLFPLFMAGGEAIEDDDVQLVRKRLEMTLEQRQFRNVQRALQVLEELWVQRRQSGGKGDSDWTQVLDELGGDLLLT